MHIYEYANYEKLIDRKMDIEPLTMFDDAEVEVIKLNSQMKYFDLSIDDIIVKTN